MKTLVEVLVIVIVSGFINKFLILPLIVLILSRMKNIEAWYLAQSIISHIILCIVPVVMMLAWFKLQLVKFVKEMRG